MNLKQFFVKKVDKTFKNKKNREKAIYMLDIVIKLLNKYEIKYYLDFGTLIGAIRDNGLILWDHDVDISILDENDYDKITLILDEIKYKYHLRTYLSTFDDSNKRRKEKNQEIFSKDIKFTKTSNYQIAKIRDNKFWLFGRGNMCIDIFFKYKFNNNLYWMAFGKENSTPYKYFSKELIEINFCGIICTIPKDYDNYLTSLYGNWKVPNKSWIENDSLTQNLMV